MFLFFVFWEAVGPLARCVASLARWPVGPLARWPVGPLAPLARWPVGPLARWPVGPLARWALGFGLRGLEFGVWPLGFSLGFAYLTFSYLLFFFSSHSEKLLTTKSADHFQVNPAVWLATWSAGCHAKAAMHVGCPCGHSAHVDLSGFFGTWWFEDTTPMSIADVVLVTLCVYVGGT